MIELEVRSRGLLDHHDLTDRIAVALGASGAITGLAAVFAVGSSVGLTVMRYEQGAVQDLLRALERAAPDHGNYLHTLTTGDPNGFAHVRSSLLGTSVFVPMRDGKVAMSDTHRVVLFDFDLKPATRTVLVDLPAATTGSGA